VIHLLSNHYEGELPGYISNSEKASETTPDIAVSEDQHHH